LIDETSRKIIRIFIDRRANSRFTGIKQKDDATKHDTKASQGLPERRLNNLSAIKTDKHDPFKNGNLISVQGLEMP
jgi:hypothetical protein